MSGVGRHYRQLNGECCMVTMWINCEEVTDTVTGDFISLAVSGLVLGIARAVQWAESYYKGEEMVTGLCGTPYGISMNVW